MKKMRFEIRDVEPVWAQEKIDELERRQAKGLFIQRPPRWGAIRRYANDMEHGAWALTHQCVAFDVADNLIDGQNRLRAVVMSGATVRMAVAYNVPERQGKGDGIRTMDTIDLGVPRNVWMALRISHGYGSEAIEFASDARNIARFVLLAPGTEEKLKGVGVSAAQTLFILDKMGYKAGVERLRALVPYKKLRTAPFSGVWCWYWMVHPKKAESFAVDYATQVNLGQGHPALKFYQYITGLAKRPRSHEHNSLTIAATVLRAHYLNERLTQIRGSDEAHDFIVRFNTKHRELIQDLFSAKLTSESEAAPVAQEAA
jgi:hypothetical protein